MIQRIEKWLILQVIVFLLILAAAPVTHIHVANWVKIVAAILFFLGLIVNAIAIFQLGRSFTPFVIPRDEGALQTSGIYRFVRHPMYSGLILLALGWCLFWGTGLGMILTFILGFVLDRKASEEEKWLTKKFPEYEHYKQRVKKLIPFIY